MKTFSILITTKNRIDDLKFTLQEISYLIENKRVECIICDDGCTDNTFEFVKNNYPKIQLISNEKSKGLIYSRNKLLDMTTADYAISLDDDAHFVSENPLEIIENHFDNNSNCGVIACRIFWGKDLSKRTTSLEKVKRVKGFIGCGHVWNMKAWKNIPNYPSWFIFYGEEEFASFQLFKNDWEVHYNPKLFVQHRVDVKSRKKDRDYQVRLRRSLRSGWYLYFLFYPFKMITKKFLYSLYMQFKLKVFKGDFKSLVGISKALFDICWNSSRLFKNRNALTQNEYLSFQKLEDSKIYWTPKD